jgi:hypothetical protein
MSDAQQGLAPDCLQRVLRSRFRQQVKFGVGRLRFYSEESQLDSRSDVGFLLFLLGSLAFNLGLVATVVWRGGEGWPAAGFLVSNLSFFLLLSASVIAELDFVSHAVSQVIKSLLLGTAFGGMAYHLAYRLNGTIPARLIAFAWCPRSRT